MQAIVLLLIVADTDSIHLSITWAAVRPLIWDPHVRRSVEAEAAAAAPVIRQSAIQHGRAIEAHD